MEISDNKRIVQRYYEELWNRWNLTVAEDILSFDIKFRGSLAVASNGLDGFLHYVDLVRCAFPDFHNTIEELVAEGKKVAARLTYRGTHTGELFEIPPTNKSIVYSGMAIFHMHDKKITEVYVLGDTLSLMKQIGAI